MIAVRMEGIHMVSTEGSDVRVKKRNAITFLLSLIPLRRTLVPGKHAIHLVVWDVH